MPIRHDTTAPRSSLWNNDHVGNLDDLDDVNAPTPSDGDAVVWDALTSTWIAAPPSGVADITDLPTAEMDDTLVLAPDGAGGVEFRAEAGGGMAFPLGETITWDTDSTYDVGETGTRPATVFADTLDAPTITLGDSEIADVAGAVSASTGSGLTVGTGFGGIGAADKWLIANDITPEDVTSYQDLGATGARIRKVWSKEYAGINDLFVDASVSGATSIDHANGSTQDLTLTGNATFTLDPAASFVANTTATDWRLIIRQDDTGGWVITWADTISWVGGTEPVLQTDPNAVDVIGILTVDDGTTFFGFHASGGASIAGIEVAETDGTPDVADVTRIEFNGATVTDDGGGQVTVAIPALTGYYEPVIIDGEIVVTDGDIVMMWVDL